MQMILSVVRSLALITVTLAPLAATAQTAAPSAPPPVQQSLPPEQLDQLVAPIALYPDTLLSEILMASTYPLEVVHAARWLEANKDLQGDKLKAAVDTQPWDDSVKSLVATPDVLKMMNTKLDWTQQLGNAVVAQQPDVMDAVQRLRSKAEANNKLATTKEQTVTVKQDQGRRIIAIAPAQPDTVYIPYYDPAIVYGLWPYPDYPPYYWPPPAYIASGIIATGIAFGVGWGIARWATGGYWGGSVNWTNNNIAINRPGGGGDNWNRGAHVEHRGGRGEGLNFRGRGGQQVLHPGNRPAGGAGTRPSTRPSAGRPNAGNRPAARPAHGHGNRAAARPATRGAGHAANRGRANIGGGGGIRGGGGGGMRARGGGGMHARGGGGRGGGGRGGRRSDIRLKHDIVYLGRLNDGLGFYRFDYNGSNKAYVGVLAQEVETVMPQAVSQGEDGYLRVNYRALGVKFESYDRWMRAGALLPEVAAPLH